jgi:DNA-binding transcriptional MerR regulator
MMTVKQVSSLTGVSARTLQFYDEIGLFKPTQVTDAGYRLYDESALEELQQILFFKELDFTLKEIKTIMDDPQFNKAAAFEKQRELIRIKRDRLNALLGLLDKLLKGEKCMEFKDFDMSEYFRVLADFKNTHTDEIVKQLGDMESFDRMVDGMKNRESEIAEMAVRQYGSIENFTRAMENNMGDFLKNGPAVDKSLVDSLIRRTDELTKALTSDLTCDPASPKVQEAVEELINFTNESNRGMDMGAGYWPAIADSYMTNPAYMQVNDQKYGDGASRFIGLAIKAYLERQ